MKRDTPALGVASPRELTFAPVKVSGFGQRATDPIVLPTDVYKAHLTHSGSGNFIVWIHQGNTQDLLVSEIGSYAGVRPVLGGEAFILDVDADSRWSVTLNRLRTQASPAFSGRGDAVSDLFERPASGAWEIKHDGRGNFIVWCRCAGGSKLVQNEIGAIDGSRVVRFAKGPCYWEVVADGHWSLEPRR